MNPPATILKASARLAVLSLWWTGLMVIDQDVQASDALATERFQSHRPMRPLPTASRAPSVSASVVTLGAGA